MDALKALKAEAERKRKALDDQGLKVRQHVMTFLVSSYLTVYYTTVNAVITLVRFHSLFSPKPSG